MFPLPTAPILTASSASATTAESPNILLPSQVDFKLHAIASPKYKYAKIALNNYPSGQVQIDPSSSTMLEFKLPVLVYNKARSFLAWQEDIRAPAAAKVVWTHEDNFTLGNSVTFGSGSGVNLVDLQWAQNYTKVARKIATSVDDLLVNDDMSGLYKSNKAAADNKVPGGYDRINGVKFAGRDNYIEPCYSSSGALNTAVTRFRRFPLSGFVGTLLAVDRDFYSPLEMFLRIQAGHGDKMSFSSDDPSQAGNTPASGAVSPGRITISNCFLYLALEQDPDLINGMLAKYQSGNLKFRMPFTTAFRTPGGAKGGPTNVQIQLSNQFGKRLKSILHTVWNPNEKLNTAYDCSNFDGEKIERYRTYMDTIPLQDDVISCERPDPANAMFLQDDWMENKKFLTKSSIISRDQYSLNWFHKDQFFEPTDDNTLPSEISLDRGLPMDKSRQWSFQATVPAGGIDNLIHYTWVEFARDVIVTSMGPQLVANI